MTQLSILRDALDKIDEAETAMLKVARAFGGTVHYDLLDSQYERVCDVASRLRVVLADQEALVALAAEHRAQGIGGRCAACGGTRWTHSLRHHTFIQSA